MTRVFVLVFVLVIASISGCIHLSNIQESYAVKQYRNETIGIEFLYPNDWYIVYSKFIGNNKSIALSPFSPEFDPGQSPAIYADIPISNTGINIFEIQNVKNTTDLYKDQLAFTLDIASMRENKLINNISYLLGTSTDSPIQSHLIEYDYSDDNGITWKSIVYLFMNENNDKVYSIMIDASLGQYYVNRDNFNTILDSLKLINQKNS